MADKARELLGVEKGVHDRRVLAISRYNKIQDQKQLLGTSKAFSKTSRRSKGVRAEKIVLQVMVPSAHIRDRSGHLARDRGMDGGR